MTWHSTFCADLQWVEIRWEESKSTVANHPWWRKLAAQCAQKYVHLCVINEITSIKQKQKHCTQTWQTTLYVIDVSVNSYGTHIVNAGHTTLILHGHIDPKLVHVSAKTNQLQHLVHMLLQYISQKQICKPNCTHMPYI